MQKGTLVRLRRDELPITYEAHGELWVYMSTGAAGRNVCKSLATGAEKAFYDYYVTTEIPDAEGHTG